MEDCIFCKIVKGEIPCAKVWEDSEFLAFLDINPNTKGMTLVIPKKHFDSYVVDMNNEEYCKLMIATKKVCKLLDKSLKTKRTALVMEGLGVNHAHIKLYPIYGLNEKFEETWAKEKVFFEKYQGYISTQLGEKVDIEELNRLAEKIRKAIE
jgi:diadenosine tetraphosphate (Ap4A) HIT family hydrolase